MAWCSTWTVVQRYSMPLLVCLIQSQNSLSTGQLVGGMTAVCSLHGRVMTSRNWVLRWRALPEKHGVRGMPWAGWSDHLPKTARQLWQWWILLRTCERSSVGWIQRLGALDTLIYNEPASVLEASETGMLTTWLGSCVHILQAISSTKQARRALKIGQRKLPAWTVQFFNNWETELVQRTEDAVNLFERSNGEVQKRWVWLSNNAHCLSYWIN